MSGYRPPRAPAGLGKPGATLWRTVTKKYELRADELVILESACRATDRVAIMEEARDGEVLATGSMGQIVVHPLVSEIRTHEAQVAGLLARLKLPDDAAGTGAVNQHRSAANSKWAAAHGAGA
jgi:hypothetical protein